MFPLFETIHIRHGQVLLINAHQRRVDKSLRQIFKCQRTYDTIINLIDIPIQFQEGEVKCNFDYGPTEFKFRFSHYVPKQISQVHLINAPQLRYEYKWTNRHQINKLKAPFDTADDIIICDDSRIKDLSYANLAFEKNGNWYTPLYPLFYGVQRAHLISLGLLQTMDIHIDDLNDFRLIKPINAMLNLDDSIQVSTKQCFTDKI